jgi:hypothetical protein
MTAYDLTCARATRRDAVRASTLNGIDCVDVHGAHLCVHFLNGVPPEQEITAANIVIRGGRRITNLQVQAPLQWHADENEYGEQCLGFDVDREGDLSIYTLCFVEAENGRPTDRPLKSFDPRYACIELRFRLDCPSEIDCASDAPCDPPQRPRPDINYLAKDYASFRQLILDRLSIVMPDWRERHVPDLGIVLVEILAYVADSLSYYQDAAGTEQYLETARQRISVRRHARLVDYTMHEGCNARAFVALEVREDKPLSARNLFFVTSWSDATPVAVAKHELPHLWPAPYVVYEPLVEQDEIHLYEAHNRIRIYTWGDVECCLPEGATHATLVDEFLPMPEPEPEPEPYGKNKKKYAKSSDDYSAPEPAEPKRTLMLAAGDFLLFEELACATTATNEILANGAAAPDADRRHRHVVRLTRVERAVDPLNGQPIVEVEWAIEDALPFPLCISAIGRAPECELVHDISIARGNVILTDHGATIDDQPLPDVPEQPMAPVCEGEEVLSETARVAARYRPRLKDAPLTHAQPLLIGAPAALLAVQEPRMALPSIRLGAIPAASSRLTSIFEASHLTDPRSLVARLKRAADPAVRTWLAKLAEPTLALLDDWDPETPITEALLHALAHDLGAQTVDVDDPSKAANVAIALFDTTDASLISLRYRLAAKTIALLDEETGDADDELPAALKNALLDDLRRLLVAWTPRADLLRSDAGDRDFVAEIDDDGRAHLRFGDGELGAALEPGTVFLATYRTGNGRAGLIGPEALAHAVFRNDTSDAITRVRNPLPSTGAVDPEPVAEVRLFAPNIFRKDLQRAIIREDYALLAQYLRYPRRNPRVQSASAALEWTGSWYEAGVGVDALQSRLPEGPLLEVIRQTMQRVRRMGHDLRIGAATLVPLRLVLSVCIKAEYQRGHVFAALQDVFSNRMLRDGSRGFFHPDNLTFGGAIYVSRIIAAAQAVDGVAEVHVETLERQFDGTNPDFGDGLLRLGPMEVARLDADPNAQENGVLTINVRGGR